MAGDQSAKTTTTRTGSTSTTRALAGVFSMSSASASASAAALCLCWALLSTAAVGGAAGSGDVSASGSVREPAFVQLAAVPDAFQSRSSFNGAKFVVSPVVAVGSKGANKVRVKRAGNGEFFHKKRLQRLKSKMRRQKFRLMETRLRNFPLSSSSSSSSSSGKKGKRFKHGSSSSSSSGGAAYSYPHQPAYYHHHQPAAVYHHQPVYHHRQAGYGHQHQLSPGYQSYGPQYNDYASHYGHAAVAAPYHGGSQYGAPVATAGTDYHHQGDYAKQSSSESASKEQVEEVSSKDQAET